MPGNCHFQNKWLKEEQFKLWLQKTKDDQSAYCKVCSKTIDIASMGRTALTSHQKGDKHVDNVSSLNSSQTQTLYSFFHTSSSCSAAATGAISSHAKKPETCTVSSYINKTDVLNAEVWWCLKTVNDFSSFSSNDDAVFVFQKMFSDSEIAKSMSLAQTKSMYLTCYGIAPYLSSLLHNKVKGSDFVMLFDESLNRELQKKQLDIWVRFWDHDCVSSRYFTSDFLGHSCALDLVQSFENCIENKIGLCNIVQLSMDGPNVNWATFDQLQKKLAVNGKKLLDIGSCGLHTLHNAFRQGVKETEWDISHKLTSLHTLFVDSPARRDDYEKVTEQCLYPLHFCQVRWVENVSVLERAIEVLPYMNTFVESVKKKKVKNPGTKSYETVVETCADFFSVSKFAFIVSVAKPVEKFLTRFQTDKPMVPFLARELEQLLRGLLCRFIKEDIIDSATTAHKLVLIDVQDKENHKHTTRIDPGFVAKEEIKRLLKSKLVSERSVMDFKAGCKQMLLALTRKLLEKSPLNKTLVRNLKCLCPAEIIEHPSECIENFRRVLTHVSACGFIELKECDEILSEFEVFLRDACCAKDFKKFNIDSDRLDKLFFDNVKCREKLWGVLRILLMLSHGQASVERGFSVNKEVTEYNLSAHNLIAQRVIYDYIQHVGGLKGVVVTKEMLQSAQSARQKYMADLDQKRTEKKLKEKSGKRKAVEDEVEKLKTKQKHLRIDIDSLNQSISENMDNAENKREFAFVTKANALRRRLQEKQEELKLISSDVEYKTGLLKNL